MIRLYQSILALVGLFFGAGFLLTVLLSIALFFAIDTIIERIYHAAVD